MTESEQHRPITINTLREMKQTGEKIACLTCYDASFARVLESAGVEVLLVGDSLGMVLQGHDTTLPVTMTDMIYHSRSVARGRRNALIMTDMPFMSCNTADQTVENAGRLMQEGGAHIVKIEGDGSIADTIKTLSRLGIPVCVHLGLRPQTIHKMGGYRVQGREHKGAEQILKDARILTQAGADMLLLECVPALLAAEITSMVDVPVIGIGAGADCDAQVLVLHDLLGITAGRRPRFSKDFMAENSDIQSAIAAYVQAVKDKNFPSAEHRYD